VRTAFGTLEANLAQHRPGVPFEGAAVMSMVRDKGYELIVGSSVDPQFGPVILFGAGGVLVEVFHDTALALPPLNRALARRLLERTTISKALGGVRGRPGVALDRLEALLVRFSYLLADYPELHEVDMNPVLATPSGAVALDARVVLAPSDGRPRMAIHPYPNQYTAPWRLRDGTEVVVRAIRPEDEPLLVAFHEGHSERTIRMRFFSMVKALTRDSLIRLCHLDYDREIALVAVHAPEGGPQRIAGVSRYYLTPETRDAEFALVVGDAWQGRGLGRHLLSRLIEVARDRGVKRLVGSVLSENNPMLRLTRELGFAQQPTDEPSVMGLVKVLS
jgi:acetyltransferase